MNQEETLLIFLLIKSIGALHDECVIYTYVIKHCKFGDKEILFTLRKLLFYD